MDFNHDAANGIAMEGYLYKRASNAFKTWSRYRFMQEMSLTGLARALHSDAMIT